MIVLRLQSPVFAECLKQILRELRQVAGAIGGVIFNQQRRVVFDVAAQLSVGSASVQIQHEAAERAFEPRQCALQNYKARA